MPPRGTRNRFGDAGYFSPLTIDLRIIATARAGQALPPFALLPIRPYVGADDPATGAHHPRPQARELHLVGPAVGDQHRPMVAEPAADRERTHALGSHVSQGHRRAAVRPSPFGRLIVAGIAVAHQVNTLRSKAAPAELGGRSWVP